MNVRISVLLIVAVMGACENGGAPAVVTPADLCAHLQDSGCLQGTVDDCVEAHTPLPDATGTCERERNELRRCYWLDLPDDAETELSTDPFDCVLSDACEGESNALCFCERGFGCYVDE